MLAWVTQKKSRADWATSLNRDINPIQLPNFLFWVPFQQNIVVRIFAYTLLHMFTQVLFLPGKHNLIWFPSMPPHHLSLIFMRMKQILFFFIFYFKLVKSWNVFFFSNWMISDLFFNKLSGIVLDVAQPFWLSGRPK